MDGAIREVRNIPGWLKFLALLFIAGHVSITFNIVVIALANASVFGISIVEYYGFVSLIAIPIAAWAILKNKIWGYFLFLPFFLFELWMLYSVLLEVLIYSGALSL